MPVAPLMQSAEAPQDARELERIGATSCLARREQAQMVSGALGPRRRSSADSALSLSGTHARFLRERPAVGKMELARDARLWSRRGSRSSCQPRALAIGRLAGVDIKR